MKTIRTVLAIGVIAAVLSSCGGGSPADPATGERGAVETVFRGYHQALHARDFTTACSLNTPEKSAELIEKLAAKGSTVSSCEEALRMVFTLPQAANAADSIATTLQIDDVTVDGDNATITWSARGQGREKPTTSALRRIDGQWRLLP